MTSIHFHYLWVTIFFISFTVFLQGQEIQIGRFAVDTPTKDEASLQGHWSAQLTCPGGDIDFEFVLEEKNSVWSGKIINGSEEIPIGKITWESGMLEIHFAHYDSVIRARMQKDGQLVGNWKKVVGKEKTSQLEFIATRGKRKYRLAKSNPVNGRYEVQFESSDDMAVGVFGQNAKFAFGTFLTTTGDYRFLAGDFDQENRIIRFSCFDGGHAFLFKAKVDADGKLQGDFWSRDSWHETWTAVKNAKAEIADGFEQVKWAGVAASKLEFPNLKGELQSLADKKFRGKIKIIQVFGSWCPNCHDASVFLNELKREYGAKGLSIIGLAFELTGDFDRDRLQIERYKKRTGANYPILIAGLADKKKATQQLRILSKVKSYPTTIFLDQNDRPIAIHSGFTGPATGESFQKLKARFRKIIEKQLSAE